MRRMRVLSAIVYSVSYVRLRYTVYVYCTALALDVESSFLVLRFTVDLLKVVTTTLITELRCHCHVRRQRRTIVNTAVAPVDLCVFFHTNLYSILYTDY